MFVVGAFQTLAYAYKLEAHLKLLVSNSNKLMVLQGQGGNIKKHDVQAHDKWKAASIQVSIIYLILLTEN